MKHGNEFNARKVDAPAMSSEASVANNFLRGVISTGSLTKNYRSVQRCNNLLSESMLTNSQPGVNHRYFTVTVGKKYSYTNRICSFLPVALASFFSVENEGPLTPEAKLLSMRAMAEVLVPMSSASCTRVSPADFLAVVISLSRDNSSSIASYFALNSESFSHLSIISSCDIINQAACCNVKSKWILSYGNRHPASVFSTIPHLISAVTSVCTALTSRFTLSAIALKVSSPTPAIALRMAIFLGVSVLCKSSNVKNVMNSPLADLSPLRAASVLFLTSSIEATLIVTVDIVLPPKGFYFSEKIVNQFFNGGEMGADFFLTNMFMVTFSSLVVISHNAFTVNDISQAVFIAMSTAKNRGVNFPNYNANKRLTIKIDFFSAIQRCTHRLYSPHLYVVNYNNKNARCQIEQHKSIDYVCLESYTVLAVAKSTAGIGTPFVIRALNRASGFFMGEAQLHLLFVVIMVGRAGEPQGSPGSRVTGSSNPVRLTTHEIGTSSGELSKFTHEDAIMATIPTQTQPKIPNIYVSDIDLERRTHEINLLLGCASFLACNATQEARRRLIDMLALAECRVQELAQLIQQAEFDACTRPARRRVRK